MGIAKLMRIAELVGAVKAVKSTPTPVDVSATGMAMQTKKSKTLAKGTGVIYSGVRTTSRGLLTDVKLEKKTLLGG